MILSFSPENFCKWQELMMSSSEGMEKGPGPNPVELQYYSPHHLKHTSLELHELPPISKLICDLGCGKIHLHQPEFNPKLERQSDKKKVLYKSMNKILTVVSALFMFEKVVDQAVVNIYMKINVVLVILRDISSYVPL